MNDIERIYSLLLHSNGLKIRAISQELELDKYYVAEIMFSSQNIPYWYQDDDSLWYAKEGALQIEEPEEKIDELIVPVEIPQKFNVNRFLEEDLSDSLRSYLSQISKYRIYSNDEMIELFKRYRSGDQKAFDMIIKSQQRLVANIAFLYCRKGAPLEDIIQEGNVGLVKAAERFDYTQYRSFSNYAKSWIFQSVLLSMTFMPYIVRLPLNQIILYKKIRKFKEKYEQINGYSPSVNDIYVGEGVDPEKIIFLNQLPNSLLKLVELHEDLDFNVNEIDLVSQFEEREDNCYYVRKILNRLKDREAIILRCYYGIDTIEETLSSIGEKMNLTRERVRQILWSSVRKLQDVSNVKREEAQIGETIRIDSSGQVARVVDTKQKDDGTVILVVKMDSGYTSEITVYDTPYHIIKNTYKRNPQSIQKNNKIKTFRNNSFSNKEEGMEEIKESRRKVHELGVLKVGDKIYYNKLYCTIKRIIENDSSPKLIIEYINGIIDVVSYNKEKITEKNESNKSYISNTIYNDEHNSRQIKKNVKVGDRLIFDSKECVVIKKKVVHSTLRLVIRYANGIIDDVPDDTKRYRIV